MLSGIRGNAANTVSSDNTAVNVTVIKASDQNNYNGVSNLKRENKRPDKNAIRIKARHQDRAIGIINNWVFVYHIFYTVPIHYYYYSQYTFSSKFFPESLRAPPFYYAFA